MIPADQADREPPPPPEPPAVPPPPDVRWRVPPDVLRRLLGDPEAGVRLGWTPPSHAWRL